MCEINSDTAPSKSPWIFTGISYWSSNVGWDDGLDNTEPMEQSETPAQQETEDENDDNCEMIENAAGPGVSRTRDLRFRNPAFSHIFSSLQLYLVVLIGAFPGCWGTTLGHKNGAQDKIESWPRSSDG